MNIVLQCALHLSSDIAGKEINQKFWKSAWASQVGEKRGNHAACPQLVGQKYNYSFSTKFRFSDYNVGQNENQIASFNYH